AIYVALVSAVIIGFGALVVDLGRLFTLQTELQNAADWAALAGAAELDGKSDSITRARAAATTALVTASSPTGILNFQTFASGGADVTFDPNADIRFLSSLPTTDDDPVTVANLTTDPLNAFYIEVTAVARQLDYLLAPVLAARIGGDGQGPTSGQASAVAVAGFNSVVCKFPPLMICNPNEVLGAGTPFVPVQGEIVQLKSSGSHSAWVPGNFGLLEPSASCGTGAPGVANCIAQIDGQTCYSTLVELKTGQNMGYVKTGLNVRFDMYQNPGFQKKKNDPNFPPAPNVTKGKFKQGNKYVAYEDLASPPVGMPMPTHPCYATSTCDDPSLGGTEHPRFAPPPTDDQWSVGLAGDDTYWEINHPGEDFDAWKVCALCPGGGTNIDSDGDGTVTRQEMYAWENDNTNIPVGDTDGDGAPPPDPDDPTTVSSTTGENGNPMTYTGSGPKTAGRRIIPIAVLNCVEYNIKGGSGGPFPVEAFAKMFFVRPAADSSEADPNCTPGGGQGSCKEAQIYMEMMGVLQPGIDNEILHDIIQLYR
ncbi:MAG: pilus assembly protein TadG-related protein, partial [Alphaproteobacteria bacterium]